MAQYKEAAERGDAEAQYLLGDSYYFGNNGVSKDLNKAVYWCRKSAEQGDANAQFCLGFCYENGEGVTKDLHEAVTWYRKSTEQGNASAQMKLGFFYRNGLGVTKDFNEAVKWYRKSAEQGNATAQFNLGKYYENGEGVSKDLTEAAKWYRKSAEQGNASAQCMLGTCYYNGSGVTKDLKEAAKWLRKSAEQGTAAAQRNLGLCYENGWGVTKDLSEAVKWYRKSAEQGDANAEFNLGGCYAKGWDINKDLNVAIKWYHKSAEQGYKEAFDAIHKLVHQNNYQAQMALGECYENGNGITVDLKEAINWYHKAAEGGCEEASEKLKSHADTGNKEACHVILQLAKQGNANAASVLEELVQKDSKAMVDTILQGFTHQLNDHQETMRNLHEANKKVAQLEQTIASTLKLSLSHANVQDVDGSTLLMNHLLHLESDVLAEPEVSDLLNEAFNLSPWHAVNREGRSLAEIVLDDRVPAVIRDHARAVMETTLADPSADPTLRSAAARALHRNHPLISSTSSIFDVPFSNLPVFAETARVSHDVEQTIHAVEEAARRVPKNDIQNMQSLIGMLQSVNTPEMQHISRLERHLPDLEKRHLAIKETHRWLTEHGSIQASENVDIDRLECIQDHRDLLEHQLREIEPIFAEVNAILPQLDANLSSLFPQIEGRADRISPKQLNDILIFIRQHFGNIAWHQQAVVSASQTLMEALRNYATSVRSVQGDLDIHHSFMKFFLAHVGNLCSDQIPSARRHVEEIAAIRSELCSKSDIRKMVELKAVRQNLETANAAVVKLEEHLKEKRSLLTAQETVKDIYSPTLLDSDYPETRSILASVEALICKIKSEMSTIQQQLDNENRNKQSLIDREAELRQQIVGNFNSSSEA